MDPNQRDANVPRTSPEPDWNELRARMLRICAYNLRGRRSPDEIQDLASDTITDLIEKYRAGKQFENIERYAAVMAKNTCKDEIAKKDREVPLPDDHDEVSPAADEEVDEVQFEDLTNSLSITVSQLPEKCRRLFQLRMKLKNLRIVAEELGLNHATALQRFKRCKDSVFAPWLADDGPLGVWVRGRLGLS